MGAQVVKEATSILAWISIREQGRDYPPVLGSGEATLQILGSSFGTLTPRRTLRAWSMFREGQQSW